MVSQRLPDVCRSVDGICFGNAAALALRSRRRGRCQRVNIYACQRSARSPSSLPLAFAVKATIIVGLSGDLTTWPGQRFAVEAEPQTVHVLRFEFGMEGA